MSDLTQFRDHCRAMAEKTTAEAKRVVITGDDTLVRAIALSDDADLWDRLADEADRFLEHGLDDDSDTDDDTPLWEHL